MGAFIRVLNSGSSWAGFVHITAVRTVILRGRQLEQCTLIHKTDLLRHPLLSQPSFAFYIFSLVLVQRHSSPHTPQRVSRAPLGQDLCLV